MFPQAAWENMAALINATAQTGLATHVIKIKHVGITIDAANITIFRDRLTDHPR